MTPKRCRIAIWYGHFYGMGVLRDWWAEQLYFGQLRLLPLRRPPPR